MQQAQLHGVATVVQHVFGAGVELGVTPVEMELQDLVGVVQPPAADLQMPRHHLALH